MKYHFCVETIKIILLSLLCGSWKPCDPLAYLRGPTDTRWFLDEKEVNPYCAKLLKFKDLFVIEIRINCVLDTEIATTAKTLTMVSS